MKTEMLVVTIVSALMIASCQDSAVLPDTGYIKSKVNGIKTIYSGSVNNNIIHYIGDDELSASFHSTDDEYLTWTITIRGVDFQKVQLPYVIKGPGDDTQDGPVFWCNILDSNPKNSAYGRTLAGTTSLYWDAKLTLTSIEDNIVKGTFEGVGIGKTIFTDGEFMAVFN